ncbi:hypothetical protein Droror1_Dr00015217, partial [Drosera rotundifolia]
MLLGEILAANHKSPEGSRVRSLRGRIVLCWKATVMTRVACRRAGRACCLQRTGGGLSASGRRGLARRAGGNDCGERRRWAREVRPDCRRFDATSDSAGGGPEKIGKKGR